MRFTIALLFAGVASASLYQRQTVPTCALTCIASANLGSCSATDNACLCKDQAFVSSTAACIQSTCTGDDLANAIAFAQDSCAAVGVTLTSTAAGSATSGGSSATSTSPSASGSSSGSSTGSSSASSSTSSAPASSSSSAAKQTGIPVFAVAALGMAAFAL